MNASTAYAQFLNQFEWNYFITCRTPYKIHTMTVTNWLFHRKQLQQNYVGKKELAEWLDVSIPTVDRLLADGMPSKKVRSRRIFNKASINQWLKS